jgi:hypothetical protein
VVLDASFGVGGASAGSALAAPAIIASNETPISLHTLKNPHDMM